jgi:hypothetical protein
VNSTSATSSGTVHLASLASALGTATNGEASAAIRWSFAMMERPSGMLDELREFRLAEVGEGSGGAALHRVEGEEAPADTAELHLPGPEVVDRVGQQPIGDMHQEIPKGSPISQ